MVSWSKFKSDIMHPTTGYWCVQSQYGQCNHGMVSGIVYLLWAPHLGTKLLLQVFLSSLIRRVSSTGPMGIQETETLDVLDGIDIY